MSRCRRNQNDFKMIQATIHLAEKRRQCLGKNIQTYHTFNEADFFREDRKPFECLKSFNDHLLQGAGEAAFALNSQDLVMLLPVVGGLEFRLIGNENSFLEVGKALWISSRSQKTLTIKNPYDQEDINFLMIVFHVRGKEKEMTEEWSFDLDANKNDLSAFCLPDPSEKVTAYIGAFEGRKEGTISSSPGGSVYAFVIQGAFEVEDRLLQPRDGLVLKCCHNITFESLSQNAIIVFFTWQ